MDLNHLSISPAVVVGIILALTVAAFLVSAAELARVKRDYRKARAREEELERALAERSAHLRDAVEQAENANRRLTDVERHDGLTGLANRVAFLEAVETEWRRGRREKTSLAVVFLAVDAFPDFDRTFGSAAGDDCLRGVAAVLGTGLRRAGDLVGRWGEEKFVVVLPSTGLEGATAVAGRLVADLDAVAIPYAGPARGATVSLSAGIAAVVPGKGRSDELVAAAKAALGEARRRGIRQVVTSSRVAGADVGS
jgi:two-component system, chemotaxis family, response regulator WspR